MEQYPQTHLLFVFAPGSARVESLGLACALGAVNSGADIRLRTSSLADDTGIHAGYVEPKISDFEWSELLVCIMGAPWEAHQFENIAQLLSTSAFTTKYYRIFGAEEDEAIFAGEAARQAAWEKTIASLRSAFDRCGLTWLEVENVGSSQSTVCKWDGETMRRAGGDAVKQLALLKD